MAVDPQMQNVIDTLDALGAQPASALDPAEARHQPNVADAVRAILWAEGIPLFPEPVGAVETFEIPVADRLVRTRLYWPLGADPGPLPVVVYGHGGYWVVGDLDAYDATARALSNQSGCIVVSVEYGCAPESTFSMMEASFVAAVEWVRDNIAQLSGDPSRIALAGESSGATVAFAATRHLATKGSAPRFVFLANPFTDVAGRNWSSFAEESAARPLGTRDVDWAIELLGAEGSGREDPRLSPAGATRSMLAGLPPVLIVTAEHDPLRDQGEALGLKLREAGVDATPIRVEGVTHEFLAANPVVEQARHVIALAAREMRKAFGLRGESAPTLAPDIAQVMAAQQAGATSLIAQLQARRGERGLVIAQLLHAVRVHADTEALASGGRADTGVYRDIEAVLSQLAEEPEIENDGALDTIRAALDGQRVEQERALSQMRAAAGNERMRELARQALAGQKAAAELGRRRVPAMATAG